MDQYHRYLQNGEEIYKKYCLSTENRPLMLPRAPQQNYIDVYPEEGEPGPSFKDDIQQQLNYEAEVGVYRSLESLEGNLIVLHNFQYTHHQYRLCDKKHVRKRCQKCKKNNASNIEGECDFLIIGKTYFVVIEVKNVTNNLSKDQDTESNRDEQSRILSGTFNKSVKQRKRTIQLIRSMEKRSTVLQFTAYPDFSKQFHEEFQLKANQESTIIFKDDLNNFSTWWEENVNAFVLDEPLNAGFRSKHQKIRNMLLAIWCTEKDRCDQTKCSLGRCISDIDKKLCSGEFTFRIDNPNVVPAPDIIRDYLGVKNLTRQQHDLYNAERKFVFIDGPAGTGKSVILIAKAIQLAQSNDDSKVIFFAFGMGNIAISYETVFEKANIAYRTISYEDYNNMSELCDTISRIKMEDRVILVHGLLSKFCDDDILLLVTKIIPDLKDDYHVFIDDFQCVLSVLSGFNAKIYDLIAIVDRLAYSKCSVWLAFDYLQAIPYLHKTGFQFAIQFNLLFQRDFKKWVINLLTSLRNTLDLSNLLSILRYHILYTGFGLKTNFVLKDELNLRLTEQIAGHYIHGPKACIYVFKKYNDDLIVRCLHNELNKVIHDDYEILHGGIRIIDNLNGGLGCRVGPVYKNTKLYEFLHKCSLPTIGTYSAEWPAVIVLHEMSLEINSQVSLYLSMSRARVYCSVILFPKDGERYYDCHKQLIVNLAGHAMISVCNQ